MNIDSKQLHVRILHRDLMRIAFGRPIDIQCLEGEFWITQDGSCADIIIAAGQTVALMRSGSALMQALAAGRLCIVEREQ